MSDIAIIDHGAGNLVSVVNALTSLGERPRVVTEPRELDSADGIILPGVGATAPAMQRLTTNGMDEALVAWEGPLLGICVGLQLFFDVSDEDGEACLGVMRGTVSEINGRPLPHMGWNDVVHSDDPIFAGIPSGEPFYFVHSYAPVPTDTSQIIARTDHGGRFVSGVRSGQRVGVQFHPERSGVAGLRLLANFTANVEEARRVA